MSNVTAVLSMLHEEGTGSATRAFRNAPVLGWTLDRLSRSRQLSGVTILCWEDQLADVEPLAEEYDAAVLMKTPRVPLANVEAVAASRRWADGWRGGLLQTCHFDIGFHAPWLIEIIEATHSEGIVLVDPAAGLIDPALIDGLIEHANAHPGLELCFSPAAPGLGGALVRPALIDRLAALGAHPGRLLHYLPDQPARDPIGTDSCATVPTAVARSPHTFRLDCDRQVARLTEAFVSLNGQLISSSAQELVHRMAPRGEVDPLPREVVIELNTGRLSRPIYRPGADVKFRRGEMTRDIAARLLEELAIADDTRLTIAGVGDPLESAVLFDVLKLAREHGLRAVHVETDLLAENSETIERLAEAAVDVVSFHVPAMTPATYAAVMGVDLLPRLLKNVTTLARSRQARGRGVPLLVPTFVKCRQNLAEMESWYDQWIKAVGSAVIVGPSDFAGQITDVSVADMTPPRRRPCQRIASRMVVLSDGAIVACEQDVLGLRPIGRIGEESIERIWVERLQSLRTCHNKGDFAAHPLCGPCKEWHRP